MLSFYIKTPCEPPANPPVDRSVFAVRLPYEFRVSAYIRYTLLKIKSLLIVCYIFLPTCAVPPEDIITQVSSSRRIFCI